jgi:hypothetical protein
MHDVLLRAAAWFERHDRIDDAIRYLLRADEAAAAATLLQSAEAWFFERGAAAGYLMLGELLPMPRSNRSWRSCSLTPRPPAGTSTGFRTGWTSVTHGLAPAPSCGTGGTPAPPR